MANILPTSLLEKLEKPFLSLVKIPLRIKMILALALTLIVSLAVVSYLAMGIVTERFNKISEDRINSLLHAFSKDIDLRKEDVKQKLIQTAKIRQLILKMLQKYEGQIDYNGLTLLLSDYKKSTGLDLLDVCDKQGIVLASGHEPGRVGENRSQDPLIQQALQGKITAEIENTNLLSGNFLSIRAAVPIENLGEIVGSLSGGYLLNRDYLEKFHELSSAHVLLLRPPNQLISTFGGDANGTPLSANQLDSNFLNKVLTSKKQFVEDIQIFNSPYRVGSMPILSSGQIIGSLIVAVPNQDFIQTVKDLRKTFITLTFFATLLSVLVSYILALRITQPVKALVDGAVAIAGGDYKQEIPVTSRDEIAMLVGAFNYMAKELRENQEKLIAAMRLAEWQEAARRIAHEIKNPLTPIALSIQNLQRSYESKDQNLDEAFKESTQTILEEVDNLRKIVNEFSAFARMPKPQKEWVNVKEILDSTISLYESLQKNVRMIKEYKEDIPSIYADPEQLRRTFSNLIRNAYDSMPQGGEFTIRVLSETVSGKIFVQIEFIDTGEGMTEETMKKLFLPYYSTKKKGTGLGLSIVDRIVSEHEGTIKVESELGKGSRFILRFPVEVKITDEQKIENVT